MTALVGFGVLVAGFLLRLNTLLVVAAAAIGTGLAAGIDLTAVVAAFGKAFNENRYVSAPWIVLPVIGVIERAGLRERAARAVEAMRGATVTRLLTAYLVLRQATAAIGLTQIAGQAQTVRPMLAPMAVAAAARGGELSEAAEDRVKAMAAATDNVGLFFGEDIFLAISSILLIRGFLQQFGIAVEPLELSVWAIPTAIAAFAIHGLRLRRFGRRLAR